MKALLWKEYRQNRSVLIAGVVAFVLPFVIVICVELYRDLFWSTNNWGPQVWQVWLEKWLVPTMGSGCLSLLTWALLGGYSLTGERYDRSAEFLAYLPISRRTALTHKIIFNVGTCLIIYLLYRLILAGIVAAYYQKFSAEGRLPVQPNELADMIAPPLLYMTATALLMFCVAWLFSSFLNSPAIDTCIGLASPLIVSMGVWFWAWVVDPPFESARQAPAEEWYLYTCLILSPLAFLIGSLCYVRRTEP